MALFETGFIMPVYKDIGIDTDGDGVVDRVDEDDDNDGLLDNFDTCPLDPTPDCNGGIPITETVLINGSEWAQVNLFTGFSWNEINAVCSVGECSGVLNGYNMAGWKWANVDDINAIFNYYLEAPIFGPGDVKTYITEENTSRAPRIFLDGMRPTQEDGSAMIIGFMNYTNQSDPDFTSIVIIQDNFGLSVFTRSDLFSYHITRSKDDVESSPYYGGWFYRDP